MTLGNKIKNRRKELNMSVDELARHLGKNRATIYRYEKGEIENIPSDVLEPLAKALKTTPHYLMGWKQNARQAIAIPEKDDLIIGDIIKSMRMEKHLTLEEYSEEINIPVTDLTLYENGDRQIPASAIDKIAKFFGVDTIDITARLSPDAGETYVNLLKKWVKTFGYASFTHEERDELFKYGRFLLWNREHMKKGEAE